MLTIKPSLANVWVPLDNFKVSVPPPPSILSPSAAPADLTSKISSLVLPVI